MDTLVMTVFQTIDPGELFGWVQTVLENLGIWTYIQMFVTLMVVLAAVRAFMTFVGR